MIWKNIVKSHEKYYNDFVTTTSTQKPKSVSSNNGA